MRLVLLRYFNFITGALNECRQSPIFHFYSHYLVMAKTAKGNWHSVTATGYFPQNNSDVAQLYDAEDISVQETL